MYSNTMIIGRLGKDPETKTFKDGKKCANFSVATTDKWVDKNTGEKQESTEWFRCTAYGRTAETIAEYIKKGHLAMFTGKMKTRDWEQDGVKKYVTELIIDSFRFLESKGSSATTDASSPNADNIPF